MLISSSLSRSNVSRFPEIDGARGIAIGMMVLYHALFDLRFFGIMDVQIITGFWRFFAYACAVLFVFIVGVSLSISYARTEQKFPGQNHTKKYLIRGLKLLALGFLITIVTWFYLGEGFIVFGILHLIGLSVILSPLVLGKPRLALFAGILLICLGPVVSMIPGPEWLIWLGFRPETFYSVDYEPLIPWFGVVLLGIWAGTTGYPNGERGFSLPFRPGQCTAFLSLAGRHSLLIYLVHQPILILLIAAFTGANIW
jgi:uncharacterized membrane protein